MTPSRQKFHPIVRAFATMCLLAVSATHAFAQPVSFFFRGIANGTFNNTSFSSANFTFKIDADGANVTTPFGASVPRIANLTAQGSLTGFSNFTITPSVFVFINQNDRAAGLGTGVIDLFAFGPIAGLQTYDLKSNFAQSAGVPFELNFGQVATSGGSLTLSSVSSASFQAVTSVVSTVPEPNTYALLSAGLLVVAGVTRRRRAR